MSSILTAAFCRGINTSIFLQHTKNRSVKGFHLAFRATTSCYPAHLHSAVLTTTISFEPHQLNSSFFLLRLVILRHRLVSCFCFVTYSTTFTPSAKMRLGSSNFGARTTVLRRNSCCQRTGHYDAQLGAHGGLESFIPKLVWRNRFIKKAEIQFNTRNLVRHNWIFCIRGLWFTEYNALLNSK